MGYDDAAHELLLAVMEEWNQAGILPTLRAVTSEVWPRNLDRHEPDLGDDAMTLGVQSSRNVRNLAARRLEDAGIDARVEEQSLRIKHAGRVLHINKTTATSPSWDPDSQRWDDSEVRLLGAQANSQAYYPSGGTLFPLPAKSPDALKHLHMTWQGLEGGPTRAWVGFPRLGYILWFAVAPLAEADPVHRTLRPTAALPASSPNFDAMDTPEPAVTLKLRDGVAGGARPTATEQP